jgi:hypothetical protein
MALTDQQAFEALEKKISLNTDDIGVFFGIAHDKEVQHVPSVDRNRFASAVTYLLTQEDFNHNVYAPEEARKTILCVDPALDWANIQLLFEKLKLTLGNVEGIDFILGKAELLNDDFPKTFIVYFIDKKNSPTDENSYSDDEKYFFYFIHFLQYALPSPISGDLINQINIQGVRPGHQKYIKNYLEADKCSYKEDNFYGRLETKIKNSSAKNVFFASAFSTNDPLFKKNINNKTYAAVKNKVNAKGYNSAETLSNRYFESSCEILTLMNNIYKAGKSVFHINLDEKFRTFHRPGMAKDLKVPYVVPFNDKTEFYINEPKLYRLISSGGSTRKSKKQKSSTKKKNGNKTRKA